MKTLGERIKFYRNQKKLTQEDVAFKLNISRLSFSKIERNITDVVYSRLLQIAKVLEVPISDLVSPTSRLFHQNDDKENEIIKLQKKVIELMEKEQKKSK